MGGTFQFTPETGAQSTLRLKVEINTREHESLEHRLSLGMAFAKMEWDGGVDLL